MTDGKRRPTDYSHKLVAVLSLVIVLAMLYVSGYFWLGDAWRPGPPGTPARLRMRVFRSRWMASLYRPAAWIESEVRGYAVIAGTKEDLFTASP